MGHETIPLLKGVEALAHAPAFRDWLSSSRGLHGRSLSDLVSRTKRAAAMFDILNDMSDEEAIFRLTQTADFKACSGNVQSQLKRAVRLYREFTQSLKR
jgi:hypothetical protein